MQNDIRYFISHKYDLGLACAAARVGWEGFQNLCPDIVAIHRHQWLEKARQIDEMRQNAIYTNETGQEIIRSPYQIMPRRIWDLQCNRVVQFRMLHSKASAHEIKSKAGSMRTDDVATTCPTFWAITHSWTKSMEGVDTTINQLEWPVPLPHNLGLATLRKDLIAFGAEYVWLDVLCLRQQGNSESDLLRKDEWKLDVPTIGNIYRAATAIIRYFNGLGQPFRHEGWDDQRHWLQRAWTLQEIKTANTTFNAGLPSDGNQISLNTKGVLDGEIVTLRQAISRVVKLATQIDSASGCNIYDLVKEMSKRYATQSTDRVSGLLYLLRIIQLPTYNAGIDHEAAWTQCFHVLPFERKLEILLDFPNRASGKISKDQLTISGRWFPTWTQLMNWPDRNPIYDHTSAALPQNERRLQLMEPATRDSFFVPDIFAISHAWLDDLSEDKYKVKAGSKSFIFYYPYVIRNQEPVFNKASQFQPFTLVTSHPDEPYNWVVCEILEKRKMMCRKTGEKPLDEVEVEVEVLRKVGVLRTDSCTELYLNVEKSDSILKKINALFE